MDLDGPGAWQRVRCLVELSEFEVNWLSVLHCCYAAFKGQMMRRMTMMRTRFLDLLKAARVFAMQMCC